MILTASSESELDDSEASKEYTLSTLYLFQIRPGDRQANETHCGNGGINCSYRDNPVRSGKQSKDCWHGMIFGKMVLNVTQASYGKLFKFSFRLKHLIWSV